MPEFQISDDLGQPVPDVAVDLTRPSSLLKYVRTRLFHLLVFPDFLERKDQSLSQAAPVPIQFRAAVGHKFELGAANPEISVAPKAQVTIRANTTAGADLFGDDPFPLRASVPPQVGYLGAGFRGALDLAISGSSGDLTFGFAANQVIEIESLKAFPLGAREASLGAALGQTLSSFVIPADVDDLRLLQPNDIVTVASEGSLQVSGGVSVAASPNPLASVSLPLGAGTVQVKAGAVAGLSASLALTGAYQVRARCIRTGVVELSFLQKRGAALKTNLSASAGIAVKRSGTDLTAALLGAISTNPAGDLQRLADLRPDELKNLAAAIKTGLDHSLQASFDVMLSRLRDDQAVFQYEVETGALSAAASEAVHRALDGDLSLLTAMEETAQAGGVLAPGLRLLSSVFTEVRKSGIALKVNLLGILNFVSLAELIRSSEVLTDPVTGDITIKETVTGTSITAISEPLRRHEALRKAIYDSVLATVTYRAGRAVSIPELACSQVHFALNQNTNEQVMAEYLSWFTALNLLTAAEADSILATYPGGRSSSCVLRTEFGDADCFRMFFDETGAQWPLEHYLELGRQALRALLDPERVAIDRFRYQIVDDPLWPSACETGANVNLGPLVGLSTADVRVNYLIGDVYVITQWAGGMVDVGEALRSMREFVSRAAPAGLVHNNEFKRRRETLQKRMAAMVGASKTRFDDPWGMVSLHWAAGSPQTAYGKAVTPALTVERGSAPRQLASRGAGSGTIA